MSKEGKNKDKEKENKDIEKIRVMEEKLNKKTAEAEEYLDRLKRSRAEFDNYRKRVIRKSEESFNGGKERLTEDLLSVLDNLQRALEADKIDQEGISLIEREFYKVLKNSGLKKMDAEGKIFDHNLHHAISFKKDKEKDEGKILEVLQPGYFWKEKVLRPAMVVVVKNTEE